MEESLPGKDFIVVGWGWHTANCVPAERCHDMMLVSAPFHPRCVMARCIACAPGFGGSSSVPGQLQQH